MHRALPLKTWQWSRKGNGEKEPKDPTLGKSKGALSSAPHVSPCPESAEGTEVSDEGLSSPFSTDALLTRGP